MEHSAQPFVGSSKQHITRMAGDTLLPFMEGDVALIPSSMHHYWDYNPMSADEEGCIRYLMVAFSHSFVLHCMAVFPELRNRLACVTFPTEALKFGMETARTIRQALSAMNGMDELERLCGSYFVGFSDITHFVRAFTKEKGVSPGKYRKEHSAKVHV
ncbi:MAG: hypothetical protein ACLTSL_00420 [Odoribacter splanchnicus]